MTTVTAGVPGGGHDSATGDVGVRRIGAGMLRVTVVSDDVEVDVSVPAGLALVALLPALSALIGGARGETLTGDDIVFFTVLGEPLEMRSSLLDNEIHDGDSLVLCTRTTVSAPVFDDVGDAVAALGATRSWSPSDSTTAAALVVAGALAVASWTVFGAAGAGAGLSAVVLAAVTAVIAGVCSSATSVSPAIVTGLRLGACVTAAGAGAALVPGDDPIADSVLAFALAAGVSVMTSMFAGESGRALFTAITTVTMLGCVTAAVAALSDIHPVSIAAVTCTVCLLAVHWTPRVSAARAGIRLTPVPLGDAGPGIDAVGRRSSPTRPSPAVRAAELDSAATDVPVVAARARTAQQYLTGYTSGVTAVAAVGAIVVATQDLTDSVDGARLAFAVVVASVLCCRGRSQPDRARSAVALASGVTVLLVIAAIGSILRPDLWPWWSTTMTVLPIAAVLMGVVVPTRRFSPVVRRTAEFAELAAVASVVPLACLIVGAFSAVRGL